ncbi:hypothetical protein WS62_29670 [Burkholderia sp. ABCPW 14]|nr:hypothetical protein WS62_29670 [Burkholderia sp. ABCPW 14]
MWTLASVITVNMVQQAATDQGTQCAATRYAVCRRVYFTALLDAVMEILVNQLAADRIWHMAVYQCHYLRLADMFVIPPDIRPVHKPVYPAAQSFTHQP